MKDTSNRRVLLKDGAFIHSLTNTILLTEHLFPNGLESS